MINSKKMIRIYEGISPSDMDGKTHKEIAEMCQNFLSEKNLEFAVCKYEIADNAEYELNWYAPENIVKPFNHYMRINCPEIDSHVYFGYICESVKEKMDNKEYLLEISTSFSVPIEKIEKAIKEYKKHLKSGETPPILEG